MPARIAPVVFQPIVIAGQPGRGRRGREAAGAERFHNDDGPARLRHPFQFGQYPAHFGLPLRPVPADKMAQRPAGSDHVERGGRQGELAHIGLQQAPLSAAPGALAAVFGEHAGVQIQADQLRNPAGQQQRQPARAAAHIEQAAAG